MKQTPWSRRIRQLQAIGLTLAEIGELSGLSTSAVGDLATGRKSQPLADAGLRLHELHQTRCKRPRRGRNGS